jgi:hypothetical protein
MLAWDRFNRLVLQEASSGIEKLVLPLSDMYTNSLVPVLFTVRELKNFTYEHSFPSGLGHIIDYAKLATALSKHGSTLETICLYEMQTMSPVNILDLISGISALKHLGVKMKGYAHAQVLFSDHTESAVEEYVSQMLPATLETIKVDFAYRDDMVNMFHQNGLDKGILGCFARVMKKRGLKCMFFVHGKRTTGREEEWMMLRSGFEDAGIEFVLEKGPLRYHH